ncbi:response regulator transcription factor [Amycolatopsis granulosa]|uniref:response regulator transcription factor n=1 Tax=Amycolatopsis granulosa TaxID=185684 RepID=UPI00142050A4|nr:LuxR C-terminal-related transcriptional regulator [Amycolatopsis granulosa]NIH84032.1 DNA-binding NarL/FixJ family response regulator [Amycolatopsis granulosa]
MPAAALVAMYVGEDPGHRRALRSLAPAQPAPRWEIADPSPAGIRAVRRSDPDIVVVDGSADAPMRLCRQVRAAAPSAVVFVLASDAAPVNDLAAADLDGIADGVISSSLFTRELPGNLFGALSEAAAVTRPPAGPPGDPRAGLTGQEIAVLERAARGMTADDSAPELGLTPSAVRSALRSAKTKLRASSRAQAVALAIRAGLFAP